MIFFLFLLIKTKQVSNFSFKEIIDNIKDGFSQQKGLYLEKWSVSEDSLLKVKDIQIKTNDDVTSFSIKGYLKEDVFSGTVFYSVYNKNLDLFLKKENFSLCEKNENLFSCPFFKGPFFKTFEKDTSVLVTGKYTIKIKVLNGQRKVFDISLELNII